MLDWIGNWLISQGLNPEWSRVSAHSVMVMGAVLVAALTDLVGRRVILKIVRGVVERTETRWDDALLTRGVFNRITHIVPALIIYLLAPVVLRGIDPAIAFVRQASLVYMVTMGLMVIGALLDAVLDIYQTFERSREVPIKGFIQIVKLIVFFLGFVFIVSIVVGRSPLLLLSGLGAMTAVLMLIFKDSILGFVAGIQLSANRMVANGDWIEMPKYGADGDVMEVALTTVKVRNWDKTITTIPTYALISDAFKNWRGMEESGGRRIKRSVSIDMNSVRFCTDEMLDRYRKIAYIREYLEGKDVELRSFNETNVIDASSAVNGRRLTNVGTFRAYLVEYLRHHPMISKDMTFLVRQLKPGPTGLPIEIYVFSSEQRWAFYEAIQSDIFDHVLSIIPEFDLRVFQEPTGADLRAVEGVLRSAG